MLHDRLAQDLYTEISRIPLIDCHSHINALAPAARSLDDLLGYHYYTELAHSVGMDRGPLLPGTDPRERVRAILYHLDCCDNTAQYEWFVEIARAFLNFQGQRLSLADCTWLCDSADRLMSRPDWADHVLHLSNIEKIFLTNDFDDPLSGFDSERYIPCLRTDDLVFHLDQQKVRERLTRLTQTDVRDLVTLKQALHRIFDHFQAHGVRACAVSLPPDFCPEQVPEVELNRSLAALAVPDDQAASAEDRAVANKGIFWAIAEQCQDRQLPFDLMIGVKRRVYQGGVFQGQDLFDQRTSLMQYAQLFNTFGEVTFCVSVLSSGQNQELASFSWIFPNVMTSGHWWYSNIPTYIEQDARARLRAVPKTKQIGYYSDMYKLEFALPKFNMYRRILAKILADDFIRPKVYKETQALELARLLLHDNPRRIFNV
jgi:glucuronate isomerase